jgi:hypothetical protein
LKITSIFKTCEIFYLICIGGNNNNPTAEQFMGCYKRIVMSGNIQIPETGNAVPQDSTRTLNLLNDEEGIVIEEEKCSEQERYDDGDDGEDFLIVESITTIKAELVTVLGRRMLRHIECWECVELMKTGQMHDVLIDAERVFQTFLNRGELHQPNIKSSMVEIVVQKSGSHNHGTHHGRHDPHDPLQNCLKHYFDERLVAYGKSLTATFKKGDKRQKTTKLVQFLGQ